MILLVSVVCFRAEFEFEVMVLEYICFRLFHSSQAGHAVPYCTNYGLTPRTYADYDDDLIPYRRL
jgi:hypothetical protein